MDGPLEDVWRAQRDATAQFVDTWRALLETTAGLATRPPAAQALEDQLLAFTRSATDYAEAALQPVRDLVGGQRDLADQMTRWAELQRDLADNMASWAAQQRATADALDRMLAPFAPRRSDSAEQPPDPGDR